MNALLRQTLRFFFGVPLKKLSAFGNVKSILIVRQHNQMGDLLIGHSLIAALHERFPGASIVFLAGTQNKKGVMYDPLLQKVFVFDKRRLFSSAYRSELKRILRAGYDLIIAPSTVSLSFTSNLLARLAKSKFRIGPKSLNGKENDAAFFFDVPVALDWRTDENRHMSLRILDILQPLNITTQSLTPCIPFGNTEVETAKAFLKSNGWCEGKKIIGMHPGAGKPQNRWHVSRFVDCIGRLSEIFDCFFYLTGSDADEKELNYIIHSTQGSACRFYDHGIPEVAALISLSDLFITNDTGIMHVGASVPAPQISLFSETNPAQWAPMGPDKQYIRGKSSIDDISVEEVISAAMILLRAESK